ncbi:uncharacterized protein LOC143604070 [Bidens hawaiensis]|uniref:uncharacterized protein LOC143604070 n=1 Tax=Bidens hawaiensis TaxID=980011 RepID=UPI00404B3979
MVLRLAFGEEVVAVVCGYAPHIGLWDQEKRVFWHCIDVDVGGIPRGKRICIGSDFNGHIGKVSDSFQAIHRGFGFGDRNETTTELLEFVVAHDLGIINSNFKKTDSHLITSCIGGRNTPIGYLLMRQ